MALAHTKEWQDLLSNLPAFLQSIQRKALVKRHRHLVVLSGSKDWVEAVVDEILPKVNALTSLCIADTNQPDGLVLKNELKLEAVGPSLLKRYLGQECEQIIWDGFTGLNPEGLGIATGLLKAGGLMFLCLPDLDEVTCQPDPDYLRMCSEDIQIRQCSSRFLAHLVATLNRPNHSLIIRQGQVSESLKSAETYDSDFAEKSSLTKSSSIELTDEQQQVIQNIKRVAKGRAHRPFLIKANRGRGKSTALGIAAAQITKEYQKRVFITGPNQASCRIAIKHFEMNDGLQDYFGFIAPDELLRTLPEAELLIVDEAASIPAPMLGELLKRYSRIVFSSTIHGYEGTGRGFAIKFQHRLDELAPQWKSTELKQPIRWDQQDPLEQWIFDALLLDAEPAEIDSSLLNQEPSFRWLERDELLAQSGLLKQCVGLLVNAHYQTAPSDIRLILDHPNIKLGISTCQNNVLGVCVLIAEGGMNDKVLAQGIIEGKRKPKHHLVPQALTYCSGMSDMMSLRTWRVLRIAVHEDCQRKGIATRMLSELYTLAQVSEVDYLSSSFGFSSELMDFWEANAYRLLRVGRHKDAASGAESVIVGRALNADAERYLNELQTDFVDEFDYALSHYHRDMNPLVAFRIMSSLPMLYSKNEKPHIVQAYACGHRAFEESATALQAFSINALFSHKIAQLSGEDLMLLIAKLWQGHAPQKLVTLTGYSGKKAIEKRLREIFASLIAQQAKISERD